MTADDELQLLPPIESSCGWAPAVFLCERRSDPPGLLLGRLDIGTSLLKGHTLSRHYHSLVRPQSLWSGLGGATATSTGSPHPPQRRRRRRLVVPSIIS